MTYDFREARILDMTREKALDLLGFPATASPTEQELKKAQREKALAAHPDRGGSVAQMQDVNRAFDFLKSAPKRPLESSPGYRDEGEHGGGSSHKREEWKRPEPVKVTFEQAKAQGFAAADVEWKFVTEWQRSPNNFFGDESMASKSAFVAYGVQDSGIRAVFVVVVYNQREFAIGSAMPNLDVWYINTLRWPINDPAKEILNPAWLTAQVVKALKFPRGEFEFDGKFNNKVRDAKGWKFDSLPPKSNSMSIKHWLVNSGAVEGGASSVKNRKQVVELKMERNPFEQKPGYVEDPKSKGNYYKFIVVVNGREHTLNKQETEEFLDLRMGGKRSLEAIYGEYYYGGEKKNLTRMPKGKGLFFVGWLASNVKSAPEEMQADLEAAKQQLS